MKNTQKFLFAALLAASSFAVQAAPVPLDAPDGGASAALIALGFAGLVGVKRFFRK